MNNSKGEQTKQTIPVCLIEECNFKHIVGKKSFFSHSLDLKGDSQCLLSNPRLPMDCPGEENCIIYQIYKNMIEKHHPNVKSGGKENER